MEKQPLRKKSENGDLFLRLYTAYQPPPGAALWFPQRQIAQARAWRTYPAPDMDELMNTMAIVTERGIPREDLEILIMLSEALFRPIQRFELELEKLLPNFFACLSHEDPPSEGLLRVQFDMLMREKKRMETGDEWILPAGEVRLSVGGRPPLIAPKVVGVAVAERLRENEEEFLSHQTAATLATALLCRPVRVEEVRHWCMLFSRVTVQSERAKRSLPRYLAHIRDTNETLREIGIIHLAGSSPSSFSALSILPTSSCVDFAKLIPQVERRKPGPKNVQLEGKRKPRVPERVTLALCRLCEIDEMPPEEIFDHLSLDHRIPKEDLTVPVGSTIIEIRNRRTGLVVATFRTVS